MERNSQSVSPATVAPLLALRRRRFILLVAANAAITFAALIYGLSAGEPYDSLLLTVAGMWVLVTAACGFALWDDISSRARVLGDAEIMQDRPAQFWRSYPDLAKFNARRQPKWKRDSGVD